MPDDVGGRPFPDGWEPDDDRGGADEDFASVVFDEDFVRAAEIHEPTAVERLVAAAQARADAEAAGARPGGAMAGDDPYDDGHGPGGYDRADHDGGPYGPHGGALRPYRPSVRWHRPVACVLALVMGVGMIVFAFAAVHRSASGSRDEQVPAPATTGVGIPPGAAVPPDADASPGTVPSVSAEYTAPPAPAVPRVP